MLIARFISVYLPKLLRPKTTDLNSGEANLIVWGGLRGGLSAALVLSLPENETKDILLIATYMMVVFSILVQGLCVEKMARV